MLNKREGEDDEVNDEFYDFSPLTREKSPITCSGAAIFFFN